ncbi:hypothetical protein OUZ56_023151 [Daphnia magna]|uniref:AIG1-type G domain-containing protein n=1 Tax=Daphnia magna TaxID=35525 RepID=A0ABR0AYF9_9CRUS|nr:hypothetical protein OUZ56_023151 [Daphnia magna]
MAEPIRISTLGRDAQVGDLYNYLTDVIVPSGIGVPNERKTISDTVGDPKLSFIYQQPEKSKRHFLGINSHLLQNMKRGSVPGHQLWFSDYLNTNSMDGDEGHAQVTLLLRVVRRTETLDLDFLRSKIDDYQLKSAAGGATHVIDEVVYGAEVICSMRKALDLSQETKESAEVSIYFAAKKYLDETIGKSTSVELPIELDQVPCTVLSSIKPGKKNEMSFHSFSLYLQNLLDTDNNRQKWKPMEFLLRNMSAAHIEAKLWSERKDDVALEKEHHQVNRKWITKEMMDISNDPSLKRFPLLEKFICYFRDLLPRFWKGIDETYKTLEMLPEEKVLEEMIYISDWLKKVMDLFACWRKDIREMCWLLKDTDLVLLEMQEIEAQMTTKDCKIAKLFVLNLEYKKVPIVNDIEELVGQQISTVMLPVLPSFSYEKEHIGCIRSALSQFANEARLANLSSSLGTSYYVALDSSTLENGAIVTIDYSGKSPIVISEDNPVEYLKKKQKHQLLFSSSSVSASLPPPLTPTVVSNQLYGANVTEQSTSIHIPVQKNCNNYGNMERNSIVNKTSSISDGDAKTYVVFPSQAEGMTQHSDKRDGIGGGRGNGSIKNKEEIDPFEDQNATRHSKTNSSKKDQTGIRSAPDETILNLDEMSLHDTNARKPSTSADSPHQKNFNDGRSKKRNVTRPDKVGGAEDFDADQDYTTYRNIKSHDNRRIAEIYADESRSYSKLIRNGSPNVYLLNATEKSNSEKINWFDICRPGDSMRSRNPKNHKIIILMGITGSGKSTLINGMINYILGVQWNDPFRFKCVREDENAARNQAHSQTSSVTAYTLHHQEGMTIPYSITIIDTPGYGNTGGVKRDKEISAAIHSFLTQQEIPIDEIHAACFVAASGDSRLTATQRYIIDSVLSIFGKDMKDNLRLLVTFADNADPPVVGACLSANFPTTSASDGIAYSKFNSSVLYCSNAEQGDDEFSFDQLFWDMGHENFKKFFDMLERMKGRDLTSTREVIHSRRQLEQSLKDIEQEMEVCLTNIENIEIFQRKMKTCGHNMEATKNFTVEQTVQRLRKFNCPKGFFAYNCEKCQKTCEWRVTKKSSLHKEKRPCENKACKCLPSDHYVDEWEWCLIPEKVSMTLQDVKAQYESNCKGMMTAEKILNACTEDLLMARAKVLSLLEQVAKNVDLLESTALRSNVLSPSDYLSLMRSRVQEEQAPGYMTRLETLDDIQRMLAGGTSQPIRSTAPMPNQGFRLLSSNTERVSDSSVTPSYGQAYNKEPSLPATQPTPVYGDVSESKSGRSSTSKGWASSFFGIGKPAESDNQSQQQKKKNETWKV